MSIDERIQIAFALTILYYILILVEFLIAEFLALKVVNCIIGKKIISVKLFFKIFGFIILSFLLSFLCIALWIYLSYESPVSVPVAVFALAPRNDEVSISVLFLILIYCVINLIFTFFVCLRKLNLTLKQRIVSSIIIFIFTLPYLLFFNFGGII